MRKTIIVSLLLLIGTVARAQTEVQHTSCQAISGSTMNCTFASNVSAGNLIVWITEGHNFSCSGTGNTLSDTRGSSILTLVHRENSTGTNSAVCVLYFILGSSGSETLTWTISSGTMNSVAYAVEFSGIATVTDDATRSTIGSNGDTSISSSSFAPSDSPSLLLCGTSNVGSASWTGATSPTGSTFTVVDASNGQTSGGNSYKFLTGTSSNVCTQTISSATRPVLATGYLLYTAAVPHRRRPSQVY